MPRLTQVATLTNPRYRYGHFTLYVQPFQTVPVPWLVPLVAPTTPHSP